MRFFKDNSYNIVKLYINQIGISIFSVVLYTAVGSITNEALNLNLTTFLSVFSTIFFLALIYTAAWEFGAKDKISIDAGRLKHCKLKGVYMALWANFPNAVISCACAAFALVYKYTLIDGFSIVAVLLNSLMRLSEGMYLGILQSIFGGFTSVVEFSFIIQAFGFAIMPLIAVAVTQLGYTFGMKNVRIFAAFDKKSK